VVGLIPEELGGLDVSWSEEGTVFVGHSVKAECCLCTFFSLFFSFFFFFFESSDYCFRVQNLACSFRYGMKKAPNYP